MDLKGCKLEYHSPAACPLRRRWWRPATGLSSGFRRGRPRPPAPAAGLCLQTEKIRSSLRHVPFEDICYGISLWVLIQSLCYGWLWVYYAVVVGFGRTRLWMNIRSSNITTAVIATAHGLTVNIMLCASQSFSRWCTTGGEMMKGLML